MMPDLFSQIVSLAIFLAFVVGVPFIWIRHQDKERERLGSAWEPVMEGEFEHAFYGEYDYVVRAGTGMTRRYETHVMKTTVIHFADGRSCVAKSRLDMPFPKGARIRVFKNGLGQYRVERA